MNEKFSLENYIRNIIRQEADRLISRVKHEFEFNLTNPVDEVFDMDGLSNYTGISKDHIYKLTSKRAIPFSKKLGKNWFLRSKIDEMLMSNPVKTDENLKNTVEQLLNKRGKNE